MQFLSNMEPEENIDSESIPTQAEIDGSDTIVAFTTNNDDDNNKYKQSNNK